ncbi:hypothetical protein [Actinomycetospora sp. NBRC 106378]|uniref:hypothetical protein n=1 Tax=Actinomycetospora sp. NBRC 106378 TaxID=3032208 RepID=UPI0024A0DF80|nr:hypothetical protein [Actinomycetospora sp. NBRC 106378]GLZ54940.1 hypothetical protein Acsp07_45570 [Actinomycetospora sp. NBRC 106378]
MTEPASGARDGDRGVAPDAAERHGAGASPRPGEEELFAALDRTRADLAAAPRPTAPEGLTASLLAAVADERAAERAAGAAPRVTPLRRRWVAAAVVGTAAAAAVLAVVVLGADPAGPPTPTAAPAPSPTPEPVVLTSADLPQALRAGLGGRDGNADPAARAACFVAHGLPAGTVPVGSRAVVLDGRPGTLYVVATGRAAVFRLLVVGPACAPGSPDTLGDVTVGG